MKCNDPDCILCEPAPPPPDPPREATWEIHKEPWGHGTFLRTLVRALRPGAQFNETPMIYLLEEEIDPTHDDEILAADLIILSVEQTERTIEALTKALEFLRT